jgi:hypothetical protein
VHIGAGGQTDLGRLSPAAQQAVRDIQAAGSDKAKVRAIMAGLTASDRQMVTAFLRKTAGSARCSADGSGSGSTVSITPSVGSDGPSAPVVNSYVS